VTVLGNEIARFVPHRYPFLLVDRVVEFEPEKRIVAVKNVTWNEPQFVGHFPDRPIMPGVLICESMAQAGGLLVHGSFHGGFDIEQLAQEQVFLVLTSLDNVKFRRQVVPGDQLRMEVELVRRHRPLWKMRGVATVDGQVVAQAEFSAVEVASEGAGARPEPGRGAASAPRVHPTAIVARGAKLDEGVEVGPYAVIGPYVTIGRGTRVGPHACIDGHTTLGADNRISPYASVGSLPQDKKYRREPSRLVIGDRNSVREFATISIGTEDGGMETVVGDDNLFMNNSHVGHDCRIGNGATLANSVALAGHVIIDDYVIVSGLAAVAQFVRLGESSFIGGGSMVVMNVPPYCMANGDRAKLVGLNVVGLERRGFTAEQMSELKRAYRLLFQSKLLARDAVERIRGELAGSPSALAMAEFVAASERGVTRP
jgi:UDP-N-acetylglucosamine acyltransferase